MDNDEKKSQTSDDLLESIFYYMNLLIQEKEFSSTITLLTDMGRTLVNSDRASFWFWDRQQRQYWTMAALDNEKITVEEGTGIVGASMQSDEIIVINNPYGDERFNPEVDRQTGYVTKSILCIPVTDADGNVIGAYQAINKMNANGTDGSFNGTDVKWLSLAAVFCGKTLESYLLYNEGLYDNLTKLKNRRGFYEYYQKRVIPILADTKVGIIMCDIDHFKRVNDKYGHNAGDVVLKNVADILNESIGIDDVAVRWGGEEFIVLVPNHDQEQTRALAEHIREEVQRSTYVFEGIEMYVTMSFGVSELEMGMCPDENIQIVDDKLYQAKEKGRNRVIY